MTPTLKKVKIFFKIVYSIKWYIVGFIFLLTYLYLRFFWDEGETWILIAK